MGVDYRSCERCGHIFNDCGDKYQCFEIEGLESYVVCGSCIDYVKGMLVPAFAPNYYCVLEHKVAKQRYIFKGETYQETLEHLKSFFEKDKVLQESDFNYGIYCSSDWDKKLQKSFLGDEDCGLTREETIELFKSAASHKSGYYGTYSFAIVYWKGYTDPNGRFEIKQFDAEYALNAIDKYIEEHNLYKVPYVIEITRLYSYNDKFIKHNIYNAHEFSFPMNSKLLQWFPKCKSVKMFEQYFAKRWNTDSATVEDEELIWKPTKRYIDDKIQEIEDEIATLKSKRQCLRNVKYVDEFDSDDDNSV